MCHIRSSSYTSGTEQGGIQGGRVSGPLVSFRFHPLTPIHEEARILLSPSHEVTYRDARCFTTWAKLSHQVVTRTLPFPSLPFFFPSLALPLFLQVLIKLFLLLRLRRVFIISRSFRAHSEPQNRYQDLTN